MRLLSQKSREYKGKSYQKFWVVIPSKILEQLGWKTGDELTANTEQNKLVITKGYKTKIESSRKK